MPNNSSGRFLPPQDPPAHDPKAKIRAAMVEYFESEIDATLYITRGDSPIENALIVAVYAQGTIDGFTVRCVNPENCGGQVPEDRAWGFILATNASCLPYESQKTIEDYRVDFVFYGASSDGQRENMVRLVVECDGHNFHERTKEQAERDRSRDRRLQELGYKVFRFTGREIYRDPMKCAEQVAGQCLYAMLGGPVG